MLKLGVSKIQERLLYTVKSKTHFKGSFKKLIIILNDLQLEITVVIIDSHYNTNIYCHTMQILSGSKRPEYWTVGFNPSMVLSLFSLAKSLSLPILSLYLPILPFILSHNTLTP